MAINTSKSMNVKGLEKLNARSKAITGINNSTQSKITNMNHNEETFIEINLDAPIAQVGKKLQEKMDRNTLRVATSATSATSVNNYETIPESVYESLPALLQDACKIFKDKNEKAVFLTGALSVLGGCFNNLYSYNEVDKKCVAANLMAFIIAPPASGKGVLKYSKKLADEIRFSFSRSDKEEKSRICKRLVIPADISSSGLIEILQQNKGAGIMVESEIDTLVNATKQDWGNYSDILRNSFENESCSLYRKKNRQYIMIENIKLSLVISGTEGQFKKLMNDSENGLFSRGCYYTFKNENENLECVGRLNSEKDVEEQFAYFAFLADKYYKAALDIEAIEVLFSKEQLKRIEAVLQKEYKQIYQVDNLHANVKRSFVIVQKIATVLSLLYKCQSQSLEEYFPCEERALQIALDLGLVYLRHGYKAYEMLPKQNKGALNVNQERLLAILPDETFTTGQVENWVREIGLSKRTGNGIISHFKSRGIIIPMGHGKFRKMGY